MRVWPSSFEGLRLSLPSGWYPLPAHIAGEERQRLLELIAVGVEDVAYVVELEWGALDRLGSHLELQRSLVLVRVPASVETEDEEVMGQLRAKLGSVRVGLVQREAPGDWPEVAWQERELKVPLLEWLRRQLHAADHPLARLDLRGLPIDELAGYTPEPVELLVMLEAAIAHRMRYFGGPTSEDWGRSVAQVVTERFVARFGVIGDGASAAALEFVIAHCEGSTAPLADGQAGARALAHAGLASIGGSDVLLGPLARFACQRDKLPRLLPLLPDRAWSEVSRRKLRRAILPLFMMPRAVLVAPEPPYSRWPALIPPVPEPLEELPRLFGMNGGAWAVDILSHEPAQKWLAFAPRGNQEQVLDSVLTLLRELDDPRFLELDVERGRLHRFDTVDHDWSKAEQGAEVRAYLRWLVLSALLRRASTRAALELIEEEIARAHELASSPGLRSALYALCGDTHASQAHYSAALEAWERAASLWTPDGDLSQPHVPGKTRLMLRRLMANLRLERANAALELHDELTIHSDLPDLPTLDDIGITRICVELLIVASTWAERLGGKAPELARPEFGWRALPHPGPSLTVTQAATAFELGDWPRALALARTIEGTLETPEGGRARLLLATIQGALGDVDGAVSEIAAIRESATVRGDSLLLALSQRALASFPSEAMDPSELQAALESALEIERNLGLPDMHLIEIERASWAMIGGRISGEQYEAALAQLSPKNSPSLAAASMQAQLRTIALFISSARARGEVPAATLIDGLVMLVANGVDGRAISPWFDRACEAILALTRDRVDAGDSDQAQTLLVAARRLASDDHGYLAEIDRLDADLRA